MEGGTDDIVSWVVNQQADFGLLSRRHVKVSPDAEAVLSAVPDGAALSTAEDVAALDEVSAAEEAAELDAVLPHPPSITAAIAPASTIAIIFFFIIPSSLKHIGTCKEKLHAVL